MEDEIDKILQMHKQHILNHSRLKKQQELSQEEAKQTLIELAANQAKYVDRFEVIDGTGRAYVKGSIYGSPVSVELSYQDDNRTLKVFVKELSSNKQGGK